VLEGTQAYRPGGLTVHKLDGSEQIVFSGSEPERGVPGVFAIAPAGGATRTLASGDPLHEPSGVAVAEDGTVYVVDIADGAAQVLRVQHGQLESVVSALGVGFPAGIALTRDDKTLLVSGIDPSTHHDVVHVIDLASGKVSQWTQGVGAFAEAAGLHRAHDRNVFAWADSQADRSGTVYVLEP
jgi:sugar lactone lactonase YvrE